MYHKLLRQRIQVTTQPSSPDEETTHLLVHEEAPKQNFSEKSTPHKQRQRRRLLPPGAMPVGFHDHLIRS